MLSLPLSPEGVGVSPVSTNVTLIEWFSVTLENVYFPSVRDTSLLSTKTLSTLYPESEVIVKVLEPPDFTDSLPEGLMLPPDPAVAVIV